MKTLPKFLIGTALAGAALLGAAGAANAATPTSGDAPIAATQAATTPVDMWWPSPGNLADPIAHLSMISGVGQPGYKVDVGVGPKSDNSVSDAACHTTVAADGTWSCAVNLTEPDGAYFAWAFQHENGGTTDVTKSEHNVTFDSSAIRITAPATGTTVTNDTPTITGTAAPNSYVDVFLDANGNPNASSGTALGHVRADADGSWSLVSPVNITDGTHTIKANSHTLPNAPWGTVTRDGSSFTFAKSADLPVVNPLVAGGAGVLLAGLAGGVLVNRRRKAAASAQA